MFDCALLPVFVLHAFVVLADADDESREADELAAFGEGVPLANDFESVSRRGEVSVLVETLHFVFDPGDVEVALAVVEDNEGYSQHDNCKTKPIDYVLVLNPQTDQLDVVLDKRLESVVREHKNHGVNQSNHRTHQVEVSQRVLRCSRNQRNNNQENQQQLLISVHLFVLFERSAVENYHVEVDETCVMRVRKTPNAKGRRNPTIRPKRPRLLVKQSQKVDEILSKVSRNYELQNENISVHGMERAKYMQTYKGAHYHWNLLAVVLQEEGDFPVNVEGFLQIYYHLVFQA